MKLPKYLRINSSIKFSLLTLVVCLLITFQVFNTMKIGNEQKKKIYFDFRLRETFHLIHNRIQSYEHVLHGVAGLFKASNSIERNEFKQYLAMINLAKNFPGIDNVGFSLIVPKTKKSQHIASIRSEGYSEYTIRPKGQRDIYTSIIYQEPFFDGTLRAFGYDMFTESVRHAAMQKAVDSGQVTASGKVKLVQDEQTGFVMYFPIYRNATNNYTVSERRAHIVGWTYAAFNMDRLMNGLFGEYAQDLHIRIFDGESISNDALMYDSEGANLVNIELEKTFPVDFADHKWTIHVSPLPMISSRVKDNHPEIVAAIGIILSVLLSLLVWFLLILIEGKSKRAAELLIANEELLFQNKEKEKRADELSISERLAKRSLAELKYQKYAVDEHASVSVTDVRGMISYANSKFCQMSGYTEEELLGKDHHLLNSGYHPEGFFKEMYRILVTGKPWHGEICNQAKDGQLYWVDTTISPFMGDDGKPKSYISIRTDITQRKAVEEENSILALYDMLTNLPNRRLLLDRLKQALASSARSGRRGALLFIDLDHFKTLNDTLGHDVGDLLLQEVASRLTACIREGDTVARFGGDEFVVLLEDLSDRASESAAQTRYVAEKAILRLNQPYLLNTYNYQSTASIGATLFIGYEMKIDELLKQADIAMYQSKSEGRNMLSFFDPKMQEAIATRVDLENELNKAIEKKQFQLYYQIQVDSYGQAIGAEALIRWQHPERGMISPYHFIPLAEETGLILPIGQWVLDAACAQLKTWQQDPLTQDLELAVNMSAKQFRQVDLVAQVKATLKRHDINPKLLKLELTESMLVDNITDIITKMNELSKIGIRFSLDDFGTGYSSLQYLKKLPLNQLKIDRSFVRDIVTDSSDRAIVRTIITMAHSLDINVIAEGVETAEQRQFLFDNGCTHYQGYLFSKPVAIDEFEALLRKS